MRLGIVACDILKPELEFLTKDDPDFIVREYLEFALHEYPRNMKEKIIETVNKYEGQVDAMLLGYAVCQSLDGVERELKVPTVKLPGSDCIDAILGGEEYAREKEICCGTWFITPGWAEEGVQGLIKELHLDTVEGYDPEFFLDMMFESYQRCLYIDDGVPDPERYRCKACDVSKGLKLRMDSRSADLDQICETIRKVKELASKMCDH